MIIYPQEIQDGISEQIARASSFDASIKVDLFTQASPMDSYLYPIKSVLVSTGWNKNDDVFDKYEVWKARKTPVNQKIDFEHDELTIIGHITNAFAFSDEGPIMDEQPLDDLPEKYHIFTEGYIYTYWNNEERKQLIAKIISEIPEDKWFVSMECVFDNFDYAVKKDDKSWVLKRNEETSFLTKHLRIFKGTGEYQGYRVGRLLRDFSFSGKGIVSKPANPDSVIIDAEDFTGEEINFLDFANSSVYTIKEETVMSDKLEELVEAKNRIKELELALANKDKEVSIAKASELNDEISGLKTDLATANCEKETLTEKLTATQKALDSLQAELAEAKKQSEAAMKEKEEMAKKAKCSQRAMKLVEAGLTETEAAEKSEKFIDVSEDIFDEFVVAVKGKAKPAETNATVVEDVVGETEVPVETTVATEDEEDTLMQSVASFMTESLNRNRKNRKSKESK